MCTEWFNIGWFNLYHFGCYLLFEKHFHKAENQVLIISTNPIVASRRFSQLVSEETIICQNVIGLKNDYGSSNFEEMCNPREQQM